MSRLRMRLLSVLLALNINIAYAEIVTIGATYPIGERDALAEIEARANKIDLSQLTSKDSKSWQAMQSVSLPRSQADRVRKHIPYYITEFSVPRSDGSILYPKGYKYNPLEYVTLPSRIYVIDQFDAEWALARLTDLDMVIISNGDRVQLSKSLGKPVFVLDSKTKARLDIQSVPTMVEQKDNFLVINEYKVDRKDDL